MKYLVFSGVHVWELVLLGGENTIVASIAAENLRYASNKGATLHRPGFEVALETISFFITVLGLQINPELDKGLVAYSLLRREGLI